MGCVFKFFWRVLFIAVCAVFLFCAAAYLFPREVLTIDDGNVKADALVVLGGGDGRAERAAELYKEGSAPHVIVTGFGDCASNIQALERNGVPAAAILAEPKAINTLENAELSLPLLKKMNAGKIIIVTSWFHSRRAVACFKHFAPELTVYSRPAYLDYAIEHRNPTTYAMHVKDEFVKLAGYWIGYGVCPL